MLSASMILALNGKIHICVVYGKILEQHFGNPGGTIMVGGLKQSHLARWFLQLWC